MIVVEGKGRGKPRGFLSCYRPQLNVDSVLSEIFDEKEAFKFKRIQEKTGATIKCSQTRLPFVLLHS